MKTINDQQLTKYTIPNGEGLTALPISFNYVVARRASLASGASTGAARRGNLVTLEIASLRSQ